MNNPNPVTYYPLTQYTINNAVVGAHRPTDQSGYAVVYRHGEPAPHLHLQPADQLPFYNLVSYGGRASYSHRLSPRLSLGASYNYNSLDFGHGQQRSGIQTISVTARLPDPSEHVDLWLGGTGVHGDENHCAFV